MGSIIMNTAVRLAVRNSGRIKPHLTNLLLGQGLILTVHGVREKKLCFSLLAIALQGHRQGGAKEYALFLLPSAIIRDPSSILKPPV
jgi:hypothetical protein